MSRWEPLRNCDLLALASSKPQIKELLIGHFFMGFYLKPIITNESLNIIGSMISLKTVSLVDCDFLTNNGLQKLIALTNLLELSFVRCKCISDIGMDFLSSMPNVDSITVFKCAKVTNEFPAKLTSMQTLRVLHLGHIKLTGEQLGNLDSKFELEEVTLHELQLTAELLTALSQIQSLKALGLTACCTSDLKMFMSTLYQLSNLERLNVMFGVNDLTDTHLIDIAKYLPSLQHMKIVMSPWVTSEGIEALAGLTNLRAYSAEITNASLSALQAVSTLRSLTCLELTSTSDIPSELLSSFPCLAYLQHLAIRGQPARLGFHSIPRLLWDDLLESILGCLQLQSLDLFHIETGVRKVRDLLSKLKGRDCEERKLLSPVLEDLCVHDCLADKRDVEYINHRFLFVLCHTKQHKTLESSTKIQSRHAAFVL